LVPEDAITHYSDVYQPIKVDHKKIDLLKQRPHNVDEVPQLRMEDVQDHPTAQIVRAPKRFKMDKMLETIMRIGDDISSHAQPENFSPLAIVPVQNAGEELSLIDLYAVDEATDGVISKSGYAHVPYQAKLEQSKLVTIHEGESTYAISPSLMAEQFGQQSFGVFADEAYASQKGYSIRVNPETGNKEMFIAGTRNGWDWFSNVVEATGASTFFNNPAHTVVHAGEAAYMFITKEPVPPEYLGLAEKVADYIETPNGRKATPWRQKAQDHYTEIAIEEGVDVIYGHSRGGAIVADMDTPPSMTKIGLDAAMILADNKGMINFYQGEQEFEFGEPMKWVKSQVDMALGSTGENNIHLEVEGMKTHELWNHANREEDLLMIEP